MKDNNLLAIRNALKASRPPNSIELLHTVSCIDWNLVLDTEIEICLDIIHRLNANIILCGFNVEGKDRIKYKEIFDLISKNINESTINIRSSEFKEFFLRYNEYMKDM
jgi:hypothetical protein